MPDHGHHLDLLPPSYPTYLCIYLKVIYLAAHLTNLTQGIYQRLKSTRLKKKRTFYPLRQKMAATETLHRQGGLTYSPDHHNREIFKASKVSKGEQSRG